MHLKLLERIMKFIKLSVICIVLTISQPVFCNDLFDFFDLFDQEMDSFENPDTDQIAKEYISFVNEYLAEYDAWRKSYLQDYDKEQETIINNWGKTTTDTTETANYSEDLSSRTLINYENNEMVIEVLMPVDVSEFEGNKRLAKQLEKTIKNSGNALFSNDQPLKIDPEKIIVTLADFNKADEDIAKNNIKKQTSAYKKEVDFRADELSRDQATIPYEVVEEAMVAQQALLDKEDADRIKKVEDQYKVLRQSNPKAQKKVLKYTVKLPNNSLSKRAEKYTDFAQAQSQHFGISAALIMAIMHSESAFNANAKSAVPAYGLMQIVPRTAGHDVNKLIRFIDKPMEEKELYIPEVNVETGSAYLSILDKRYLKSISNPESRIYCTIAAYNTGAGNVAKVFNKQGNGNRRNITKAAKIINQLSPEEVYQALIERLPYDETKYYLKKVSKRIPLYEVRSDI